MVRSVSIEQRASSFPCRTRDNKPEIASGYEDLVLRETECCEEPAVKGYASSSAKMPTEHPLEPPTSDTVVITAVS